MANRQSGKFDLFAAGSLADADAEEEDDEKMSVGFEYGRNHGNRN